MQKKSGRRPSAGVVIGIAALVLAIAGTAVAGSTFDRKLSKTKVKAIAAQQVKNLAPGLSVESAKSADSAKAADSAKIATNILSANVRADGTLVRSIPPGATSAKTNLGTYTVSFGRSLGACTITAGAADAEGGPDVGFAAAGVTNDTTLQVFTRTAANVVADEPFYVQAICPA